MTDEGRTGRYREAVVMLVATYNMTGKLLAELPIPIRLPEAPIAEAATEIGLLALDKAQRHLVPDQPMPDEDKRLVQELIVDWLTAWELGRLLRAQGFTVAPWRLEALELAMDRITVYCQEVSKRLGIDLGLDD